MTIALLPVQLGSGPRCIYPRLPVTPHHALEALDLLRWQAVRENTTLSVPRRSVLSKASFSLVGLGGTWRTNQLE